MDPLRKVCIPFYEKYGYYDPRDLWECYLAYGTLTRWLDAVTDELREQVRGGMRELERYEYRDWEGKEGKCIVSPRAKQGTFRSTVALTPTVIRLLLSHRGTLLHLGTLGLLCYLDKHCSSLVHEFLKTVDIKYEDLVRGMNLAKQKRVHIKLRSRPDIGYKHRSQNSVRRGG